MRNSYFTARLLLALGLATAGRARAQAPTLTALLPAANASNASPSGPVMATFSQPLTVASAGALKVFSSQRGGLRTVATPATVSGNTLGFAPPAARPFAPGEVVQVGITRAAASSGGSLAQARVAQFTVATGGTGRGQFAAPLVGGTLPITGTSIAVVGDVDGDGDLDIVANSSYGGTSLSVRLNDGTGQFLTPATNADQAAPVGTSALALGDVDADGDLDVVTITGSSFTVYSATVLRNNGAGVFTAAGSVTIGGGALSVVLGDVDGDGDLDIVTANYVNATGTASVRLNNGSGTFTTPTTNPNPVVGGSNNAVVLGDVDGDGDLDLLAASSADNTVGVRFNNGSGSFAGGSNYAVGRFPNNVTIGDVDGDGDLDFLAANANGNSASLRLNNGSGVFAAPVSGGEIPAGLSPQDLSLGDVDADGDLDLLVANYLSDDVSLRLNNGSGGFSAPAQGGTVPMGFHPYRVLLGDFDNDQDLDLLSPNSSGNSVNVRFNQTGLPVLTALQPAPNAPAGPTAGPVQATFDQPLTAASAAGLRVFGNQRGGLRTGPATPAVVSGRTLSFTPPAGRPFLPGETVQATLTRAVAGAGGPLPLGRVWQFTGAAGGEGTGKFVLSPSSPDLPVGYHPYSVALGDLDGDGDVDVLYTTQNAMGSPSVLLAALNDGAGTLTPLTGAPPVTFTSTPSSTALADVDGDGDLDVLAIGSAVGTAVSVRLNDGTGRFTAPSVNPNPAVGTGPQALAVGDVDGDGDLDFVTANHYNTSAGTVSVRLNDGTGNFTAPAVRPESFVGNNPNQIALADMDGDGDLDIITANQSGSAAGSVSVRYNDGNGIFFGPNLSVDVAVGMQPQDMVVGDVDNDGDADVITCTYSTGSGISTTVSVRLNDGTGLLSVPARNPEPSVGSFPRSLALADVDADGDLDLLAAGYPGAQNGALTLRLNDGTGSFMLPPADASVAIGNYPVGLAVADMDGDGDLDAVSANLNDNTLSVRFNTVGALLVTGVSPAPNTHRTPVAGPVQVTFNQPLTAGSASALSVFSSQRGGLRTRAATPATVSGRRLSYAPPAALPFAAGELLQATLTTAATSSSIGATPLTTSRVWQFRAAAGGPGTGNFVAPALNPELTVGNGARQVAVGDVDGDGDLDFVTANYPGPAPVSVALNDGTGTYTVVAGAGPPVVAPVFDVALADVDGDGDLDLLSLNFRATAGTVSVCLNDGSGTFGAPVTPAPVVGNSPQSIITGDVDADGDLDLLTVNVTSGSVSVRLNNGSGTFTAPAVNPDVIVGNLPYDVALADVDGDGDLDLLAACGNDNAVSVRLNNGRGSFTGSATVATGSRPYSIVVGDFDADGDADFATANVFGSSYSIRFNNGSGTFVAPATGGDYPLLINGPLALGDVDADGDLDLLIASSNQGVVSLNDGAGGFATAGASVLLGRDPQDLALADVDGDGDLDLLSANTNSSTTAGTVSVRHNSLPAPTITGLSPASGVAGTSVTLTGTALTGATLLVNGVPATITAGTGTSLTFVVPAGTGATQALTLSAATGTVSSAAFTVQLALTATAPLANARSAPRASSALALTFTEPVAAASLAGPTGVGIFSAQAGGRKAGTWSGGGTAAVSFTSTLPGPRASFQPGEVVSVTVPATVRGLGGLGATRRVLQFTAATDGPGRGYFLAPALTPDPAVGSSPAGLAGGDLDNDGDLDLLAANTAAGTVSLRFNNGTGSFTPLATRPDVAVSAAPVGLALADIDGDGDLDLLTSSIGAAPLGSYVSVRLNDGTGLFTPPAGGGLVLVGDYAASIALGDVDGDGDLDLLTTSGGRSQVSVRFNDGAGTFTPGAFDPAVGGTVFNLALGDIDGDGDLDFVTTAGSSNSVFLSINDGAGTFSGRSGPAVGTNPADVALADVDGDGDLDIVTTNYASGTVSVRLNNGTGLFTAPATTPNPAAGASPGALALGDVDADGDLDLLVTGAGSLVTVLLNNGAGGFASVGTAAVGPSAQGLILADVDGDGDLDLATTSATANTISLRLNEAQGLAAQPARPVASRLTLSPNPAAAGRTVAVAGLRSLAPLELRDALGRLVLHATADASGTARLPLPAGLAAGVYVLRSGAHTQRLAVE